MSHPAPDLPSTKKNLCFGCGPDNPGGMKMEFAFDAANSRVLSRIQLDERYTGPPGHCHGGIIAVMLDEIMAKLNKLHGVTAVTAEMTVKYLRPVPLNQPLRLEAWETGVEGRRRSRKAQLLNQNDEVLARGEGVFITVDPEKAFPGRTY